MAMPSDFIAKSRALLKHEREAEILESQSFLNSRSLKELEQRGVCLSKLRLQGERSGLYGRQLFVFEPWKKVHDPTAQMPANAFSCGDIVDIQSSSESSEESLSGIITKCTSSVVEVAVDPTERMLWFGGDDRVRLTKLANDVTHRRLIRCLEELEHYERGLASHLISVLLQDGHLLAAAKQDTKLRFVNPDLNTCQQDAVRFALSRSDLAVIHGPPGTGKTTTVVEVIVQAVRRQQKVLACAPSNIAVDNLVERLARSAVKIVRLGHPARASESVQRHSLDAIVLSSDQSSIIRDVRSELDSYIAKSRSGRDKGQRHQMWGEVKQLRKELRQREERALQDILSRADVVLSTLTSASLDGPLRLLPADHFHLAVIDEAAQAIEVACWLPLLRARCCLLAGDHLQLPPTILSQEAASGGLANTLMERVVAAHGDTVVRMLTTQYRMNATIMQWASEELYHNALVAHPSVTDHLLCDCNGVERNSETILPLLLIDTAGCDLPELDVEDEMSKGNEGEADLVAIHAKRLLQSGVPASSIAVISPYNLQVELIRHRLMPKYPAIEVHSVDGFQGREKEAVIISLVRSNNKGQIGFLSEDRRLNVAITRARRHLAVVCDSDTVKHHAFLKRLVEYLGRHGEVRSSFEYQQEADFGQKTYQPHPSWGVKAKKDSCKQGAPTKGKTKSSSAQSSNTEHYAPARTASHEKRRGDAELNGTAERLDEEEERKSLRGTLLEFVADESSQQMSFPSVLNSFQRRLVHELAEDLGLLHVSTGQGTSRHIEVRKNDHAEVTGTALSRTSASISSTNTSHLTPSFSIDTADVTASASADLLATPALLRSHEPSKEASPCTDMSSATSPLTAERPVEDAESCCPQCQQTIPAANLTLHSLRCTKFSTMQPKPALTSSKKQPPSKTSKKATGKKQQEKKEDRDDVDSFLDEAVRLNSECSMVHCKTSVKLLGRTCSFCVRCYCMSHSLPEVHGCGDAARRHARSEAQRLASQSSRSASVRPVSATKKAQLQRKLHKQLDEMQHQRAAKPSKKS